MTCNFCGSKLEIIRDHSTTHSRVLDKIQKRTNEIADDVRILKLQNQLEQLDRQWTQERSQYLITDKHGAKHEPGPFGSVIMGVFAIGFGVFWMIGASAMPGGGIFPLFGLIFIGGAIFSMVNSTSKANQLQKRREVYEQRRESLLREIDGQD